MLEFGASHIETLALLLSTMLFRTAEHRLSCNIRSVINRSHVDFDYCFAFQRTIASLFGHSNLWMIASALWGSEVRGELPWLCLVLGHGSCSVSEYGTTLHASDFNNGLATILYSYKTFPPTNRNIKVRYAMNISVVHRRFCIGA